jgi:hypothetical protein
VPPAPPLVALVKLLVVETVLVAPPTPLAPVVVAPVTTDEPEVAAPPTPLAPVVVAPVTTDEPEVAAPVTPLPALVTPVVPAPPVLLVACTGGAGSLLQPSIESAKPAAMVAIFVVLRQMRSLGVMRVFPYGTNALPRELLSDERSSG